MLNYLRNIFSIQQDLQNRTLQNSPTWEFALHERGRVRPITSTKIRDRIVRHVLCDDILLPEVKKHIIYDNCASIKGRGISQQRKRFEVHLRRYYKRYGNDGWILFGDFSKFRWRKPENPVCKRVCGVFPSLVPVVVDRLHVIIVVQKIQGLLQVLDGRLIGQVHVILRDHGHFRARQRDA